MVRLVFRPYTQLRRSICTSESLRSSIRVSPDFNLARHSSPSFGSQHLRSTYSQRNEVDWKSRDCALRIVPRADELLFAFTAPLGLVNPMARVHVRLLGPCFKTGRRGHRPTRQRDANRDSNDARYTSSLTYLSATEPGHRGLPAKPTTSPRALGPRPTVPAVNRGESASGRRPGHAAESSLISYRAADHHRG